MRDRLIIATKVKKTIEFIDKTVVNYGVPINTLENWVTEYKRDKRCFDN